jgi:Holliday junction resolvase
VGKEKSYENKIKRYLKDKGCYRVKYFGCTYSEAGTPDILACVNGYFLAIEVKAEDGKPSELQLVKIDAIRKAGGFAYVAYPSGWNRLKDIIDGLLIDSFSREEDIELRWVR